MTSEPSPPAGSLPPVPAFDYAARLALAGETPRRPGSWYITHGIGGPARGTYTEVAFTDDALGSLVHATSAEVDAVLDELVQRVAGDLYGRAYAFTYRPDQYDDAIARHGMRRRERVVVTRIDVYTDTRKEPRP